MGAQERSLSVGNFDGPPGNGTADLREMMTMISTSVYKTVKTTNIDDSPFVLPLNILQRYRGDHIAPWYRKVPGSNPPNGGSDCENRLFSR